MALLARRRIASMVTAPEHDKDGAKVLDRRQLQSVLSEQADIHQAIAIRLGAAATSLIRVSTVPVPLSPLQKVSWGHCWWQEGCQQTQGHPYNSSSCSRSSRMEC